jgi:hypothetical protein
MMYKVQKPSNSEWGESSGYSFTDQIIPLPNTSVSAIVVSRWTVLRQESENSTGAIANKVSNGTNTSSKETSGLPRGYIFFTFFESHLLHIMPLSLSPSRAVKKMTQFYKAYTDVTCTAV